MQSLDVHYRSRPADRTTRAELADLGAHLHMLWPILPAPMVLEWSDNPVIALEQRVPWIYAPVGLDPLRNSRGASVAPRRVRTLLKTFDTLRIPFQRVAIAHELDPDGPVRYELTELQSGPRACTDEDARRLVGKRPANHRVTRFLGLLDAAICGATFAPRTRAGGVLKHVIYGVVAWSAPRHGELSLWYPLASWRW